MKIQTPHVDWLTLSPELSLLAAGAVCLLVAVLAVPPWRKGISAFVTLAGFVTAGIFAGVVYNRSPVPVYEVGNAIVRDRLGALGAIIVCGGGVLAVFVAYGHRLRDEYASIRLMFRWTSAARFPTASDAHAITASAIVHRSSWFGNATLSTRRMRISAVAFVAADMKAVTGVGAPW